MKTFLQLILLAAIFYNNSTALKCNICKPTADQPFCEKYEEKECDSNENVYCLDIYVTSRTRNISFIQKSCASEENIIKRCSVTSDGGMCVPCKRDLCNRMTLIDFQNAE